MSAYEAATSYEGKRVWRVGSISTGVTFILIGAALAASLWIDFQAYEAFSWIAPILFMMLGAEVLFYVKYAGSAGVGIRYDWFSIFVVGVIGLASLGLTLLMSTGLFDELQRGLQMTQRSVFVEAQSVEVPEHISNIVVHSLSHVEIEETHQRELQLFGQVQYWSSKKLELSGASLLQINVVDSTMYVMIGAVDRRDGGLVSDTVDAQLTLVVPEGIEVTSRGQ